MHKRQRLEGSVVVRPLTSHRPQGFTLPLAAPFSVEEHSNATVPRLRLQ
jgi:hypothetical protein